MNYGKIKEIDVANGPGVRVSLFVSGCRNKCPGCFNKETWDFAFGEKFGKKARQKLISALRPDHIAGLTILGGDPFEEENQKGVYRILAEVKELFPQKTIWIYTGYTYEELLTTKRTLYTEDILRKTDVLVDGRFELDKSRPGLQFRGSSNQRIIDVPGTVKAGTVMLLKEYLLPEAY